jgi:phospholipid/cholesterol/gamma-HCH transport system substrate-binding protein
VHNLAGVTRAASQDKRLGDLVIAANVTLRALAEQDVPLRSAISKLPGTLDTTKSTLINAATFADKLTPTTRALLPAVRRLPAALSAFKPFADEGTNVVGSRLRPFVREALPLVRNLGPAVTQLNAVMPDVTTVLQVSTGLVNTLAYNAPGDDEGFLFWTSWFAHNWNSLFSSTDAHGGIGRAMVMANCQQLTQLINLGPILQYALGVPGLCQ